MVTQYPSTPKYTTADLATALDKHLLLTLSAYAQVTGERPSDVRYAVSQGRFPLQLIRPFGQLLYVRASDVRQATGKRVIQPSDLVQRVAAGDAEALNLIQLLAAGDPQYTLGANGQVVEARPVVAETGPTSAERLLAENELITPAQLAVLFSVSYVAIAQAIDQHRLPLEIVRPRKGRGGQRYVRSTDVQQLIAGAPIVEKAAA